MKNIVLRDWPINELKISIKIEAEYGLNGYISILDEEIKLTRVQMEYHNISNEECLTSGYVNIDNVDSDVLLCGTNKQWITNRYRRAKMSHLVYSPTYIGKITSFIKSLRPVLWKINYFSRNVRTLVLKLIAKYNNTERNSIRVLLENYKHVICASEKFAAKYSDLLVESFGTQNTIFLKNYYSDNKLVIKNESRVKLVTHHPFSNEGWILYGALYTKPNSILIKDSNHSGIFEQINKLENVPVDIMIYGEMGASVYIEKFIDDEYLNKERKLKKGFAELSNVKDKIVWPMISIVLVSFNQVEYIERCIQSILLQGYPNLEFIVVDGNSTDGTINILRKYEHHFSRLIIEDDGGQSQALNKGFSYTTGVLCNWICSDDMLEEESLFVIAKTYMDNHDVDIIIGGCRLIDDDDNIFHHHHTGLPLNKKLPLSFGDLLGFSSLWQKGVYFFQPEVFFTKKLWEKAGEHVRDDMYYAMDYEMYLRFSMVGAEAIHIPNRVGFSRVHSKQKTNHDNMKYLPTIYSLQREYYKMLTDVQKQCIEKAIHQ